MPDINRAAGSDDAPLAGLKVIELARILAGPWIGQTLADLGADVIKVESPQGDDTRRWGPPFITVDDEQSAAYFHACNRGKRSITADFASEEGQSLVRRLVRDADVLIENFKVGGLAKYGLDYDSLREINPRLIYCSVTGFGQNGPYAKRAGYDFMIQGMGGIMDLTGEMDGPPEKIGVAFVDIFTGVYGVVAIQAALWQRERTGLGQHVDMALFDCITGVLANQAMNYLASGIAPKRLGNAHPNIAPYQTFSVVDGFIILAVGNDGQFQRLLQVLGLNALASDPRFASNASRVSNRDALATLLGEAIAQWPRDKLLSALEAEGVPAGPINTVADVFADPQIKARGMQIAPQGVPGVRTPITLSGASLTLDKRSPRLGEHTAEILAELDAAEQVKSTS
ncbi:CaiB/BaiF CoA transferase family protein [Pseudochelatococcus contaminans]|uniref:Crotonobetainyl-CoA:carnitine CoA-transferase CaiB-like acyl-CoA transferase n=1 Tax=Pseudochelatococcus contaminans TaxID=1538103 RepID=A0A7W5Z480_9HYPH|nr:CaiB/BaiF CoA-transferase family protein [Pseudochelatococcus contaminans]MBB3809684.1 crotonobetainyl-CoA:carnitine CoA-transferase CaiB-like acyl-CoA transferase [Pseudochelatococcus contaminans]